MTVSIRDVRTRHRLNLSDADHVLRVSNDLDSARVAGPWYLDHGYARLTGGASPGLISAAREDEIGHCAPGDMVLAHLPDFDPTVEHDSQAWWLCEVCSIDDDDAG